MNRPFILKIIIKPQNSKMILPFLSHLYLHVWTDTFSCIAMCKTYAQINHNILKWIWNCFRYFHKQNCLMFVKKWFYNFLRAKSPRHFEISLKSKIFLWTYHVTSRNHCVDDVDDANDVHMNDVLISVHQMIEWSMNRLD